MWIGCDSLRLFLVSCFFGFLLNAYDLFAFTFSIDEEVRTVRTVPELESHLVGMGRWAAFLLDQFLIGGAPVPVVPVILCVLATAGAYTAISTAWEPRVQLSHYLAAPFATAFPTLLHLYGFADFGYVAAIGMLFAGVGFRLLGTPSRSYLGAGGAFTLAAATYTPVVLIPLIAGLVPYPQRTFAEQCRDLLRITVTLGAALIMASIIWVVWLKVRSIPIVYVQDVLQPAKLAERPWAVIVDTANYVRRVLFGRADGLYPGRLHALAATFIVAASAVVLKRNRVAILLLTCAVLLPFAPVLLAGGDLPHRSLLGLPLALAGLVFTACRTEVKVLRGVLCVLVAYCTLQFAVIGARSYYATYIAWLNDRALAIRIFSRIESLSGSSPARVEFVGVPTFAPSPQRPPIQGPLGSSFFRWDGGSPQRIQVFLQTLGLGVELIDNARRHALWPRIRQMPEWPAEDSVALIDGVIVVKFSDYTPQQRNNYGLPS